MPNNLKLIALAIFAVFLLLLGGWCGWSICDWLNESEVASLQKDHVRRLEQQQIEINKANARTQAASDDALKVIDNIFRNQFEVNKHAQDEIDRLSHRLRTGDERLSIAVANCRAGNVSADSATAASHTETRADIDPRAAEWLVGLTARGDSASSELNACIDAYNTVREKYKAQNAH